MTRFVFFSMYEVKRDKKIWKIEFCFNIFYPKIRNIMIFFRDIQIK